MNRIGLRRIAFGALLLTAGGLCASAFATCTSSLAGSTATVTCDAATDDVQIGRYPNEYSTTGYFWLHRGAPIAAGEEDWDTNAPSYQFFEAGAASTINVHLAGGTLTLGVLDPYFSSPADAMAGIINWTGTGSVVLDSSFSTSANTYTVDDGNSPFATTVNALTLFNKSSAQITIITGTAADAVNVLSVYSLDSVEAFNHSGGGTDAVHVGKAGSVQGVKGALKAYGYSTLMIDDSADGTARNATIASNSIAGLAPGTISWSSSGVINAPVAVFMGTGDDTLNVQSTDRPVMIDGNSGSDTVNIGNGGNAQGILGALDVSNFSSRTAVNIDDSVDTTGRTATYTTTGVTGLTPAAITWPENDISAVTLRMGVGVDTVKVWSVYSGSGDPLTIHGTSGLDSVYFGDASGNAQQIMTPVMVDNSASYTAVFVDDSADLTGRSVAYSKTGISGVAPGRIGWASNDVGSVRLYLGSGSDVVHVFSSNRNVSGRSFINQIDLGGGNNLCYVTGSALGTTSVNRIYGNGGDDSFVISAVATDVGSVNIYGGAQAVWDELVYTGGPVTGAFPGNGTLTPTDLNAHAINYDSIEHFSINDLLFRDGFQ
jgi:hypothetical protein